MFCTTGYRRVEQKTMNTSLLKYCLGFPVLTALFLVCFLSVSGLANPPVHWETDLNIAMARAEREQRPLFLHFVGGDGSSAQQMGNEVFVLPNIASHLNANYVMVRINAVDNPALAQRFSITAIPTDLIMRPNGQLIHRRVGVITADRFAQYLVFLQETIQSERNQASTPPPAVGSFPVTNHPQVSSHPVPPHGTMPARQQEMIAAVPGAVREPFAQPPPVVQQPPVAQYPPFAQQQPMGQHPPFAQHQPVQPPPFTQHPSIVAGTAAAPSSSANNPLRTTETAARPAWEQNAGATHAPPPMATATMQAMLEEPTPDKMTVEVPLALEGFCPVMLCTEERWVSGNPAYCTMYQGHIFRFSSQEALVTFAQNPAHYTPIAMGEDVVLKVDRNRRVNGDRRFGAWFQGRVFLFSSQETFSAFEARPDYYAEIALKYEIARRERPTPIVY